jgi:hypothetical protein
MLRTDRGSIEGINQISSPPGRDQRVELSLLTLGKTQNHPCSVLWYKDKRSRRNRCIQIVALGEENTHIRDVQNISLQLSPIFKIPAFEALFEYMMRQPGKC